MIDRSTIDRIIDVAEITEVIQDFVTLKKRGVNFLGLCPFHNEKTPSFTVSPTKGIYKCFGCGRGGNAVNFIMEHEHLSYPESLKYLARKYHIEVIEKELTVEEKQQQNEKESLLVVLSFAKKYFHETLFRSDEGISIGLSYFKERSFRQEVLKKFEVGYSPEQRNALTSKALDAGYKLDFLTKTGLTIEKENYRFDRFAGRIIFPIHSLSGQVVGFGGRILKSDAKAAKYLNSPESDIYHKSRVLYGLYQAKKEIVAQSKCFLVEGYTDVLALHQADIENVVASSGTALSSDQVRLIKRFTPNITILFDGDDAGLKASFRGIDIVLEEGLNVKVVMLPEGEDPDSYSKKISATEFSDFISENEKDFIKFKTELLIKESENDPISRANLIRDIVRSISVIPDSINRSVYLKECSILLKVDEKVLYHETNKIRRFRIEKEYKKIKSQEREIVDRPLKSQTIPSIQDDSEAQEREIIRLLLNYGSKELFTVKDENDEEQSILVLEYIIYEIQGDELSLENMVYQQIFEECSENFKNNIILDQKHFINHSNSEISKLSAQLLSLSYDLSKIWKRHDNYIETEDMKLKEVVPETVNSFKSKRVIKAQMDLQEKLELAQKENKLDEITELQEQIISLNNLKREISKNLGDRIIIK
ncbi:MAG: DNA primase [Bacteroidota bacterium]|nr:DNA primase [Bacteroidota bacterium]